MDVQNQIKNIETVDPYAPLYNVGGFDDVKPYPKYVIDAANHLTKLTRGKRETVKTSHDWFIVSQIFEFWTRTHPQEWQEFASSIKEIKATRARKDGKSKLGTVKYVGALPQRFMQFIKWAFPLQQFDKEFVNKLVKNIHIIQVGERNDSWFTIPGR